MIKQISNQKTIKLINILKNTHIYLSYTPYISLMLPFTTQYDQLDKTRF